MSKRDTKFFVCLHGSCPFKTDKRKAIYTHLVRTHSERKEDYECEYCSTIFRKESDIEQHLNVQHPSEPFTYTCVSRIENIINKCAQLGADGKRASADEADDNGEVEYDQNAGEGYGKFQFKSQGQRTKASVNESLNNLAKKPKSVQSDSQSNVSDEIYVDEEMESEEEGSTTCQPAKHPGLKIKFNLKKIAECSSRSPSRDRSNSPPYLEPNLASNADELDSSNFIPSSPPDILPPDTNGNMLVRAKSSKYVDRMEVYHRTDALGRRCCPFCDYKTTKNTIRVHLSGIHKIFFVQCSLCEYKAAFPHQITQHGVKFHKTTNLSVLQVTKEAREQIVATLPRIRDETENVSPKSDEPAYTYSYNSFVDNANSNDSLDGSCASYDSLSDAGEDADHDGMKSEFAGDDRVFKAPKCQTSKTDYYSIHFENGVYMYSCNMCTFQTPVRATIYTHKYRHEEKSYLCGYCDYMSSPRSNVVHHSRGKHKNMPVKVISLGDLDDVPRSREERRQTSYKKHTESPMHADDDIHPEIANIKREKPDAEESYQHEPDNITTATLTDETTTHTEEQTTKQSPDKTQPTIIKVPQFKRSLTSVAYNPIQKADETTKKPRKSPTSGGSGGGGGACKLSVNKQYKINPNGSPKYLCMDCPYACDTHPKMKHHLYRHRPQQYKCPYCEHRKYPRSYVVRHVRDTHRDKPVRVIDLAKGNEPIDIPEYMDDTVDDVSEASDQPSKDPMDTSLEEGAEQTTYIQQEMRELHSLAINVTNDTVALPKPPPLLLKGIKQEPDPSVSFTGSDVSASAQTGIHSNDNMNAARSLLKDSPILRNTLNAGPNPSLSPSVLDETPDVSPNFSEAVYTSTPLIESLINGQYPTTPKPAVTKNFEKKKSLKDYSINNTGVGPRYSCNICGYGTENYKTIHNHMYRHETQRYQCPYCGYRRSPRSFVENHIREVHKGHPVIVTELKDDHDHPVPLGSPRQCGSQKRKEIDQTGSPVSKKPKDEFTSGTKLSIKWPAPKPANQVNLSVPNALAGPQLQIPVKQKTPDTVIPPITIPTRPVTSHSNHSPVNGERVANLPPLTVKPSGIDAGSASLAVSPASDELTTIAIPKVPNINETISKAANPFKFKEGSRTTFKTMYKCVFDSETCNHISKDKSKMKQHLFMHVEYKPWTCDFCDMTASQSSHIKNHVKTDHPGVPDVSFKYKRHNYLEKHIESFLTRGLFTVPVNEYRMIMDMKGNTKASQKCSFARDHEGNILCPHCDYKTKSGGMTDHVKMRHMQPRFKCHWCDYRAFYRSEVRKHHRKERSHMGMNFKTQELDLTELMEGFKERKGEIPTSVQINPAFVSLSSKPASADTDPMSLDMAAMMDNMLDEDMDLEDDDEDDDDMSSDEDSSLDDSMSPGSMDMSTGQLTDGDVNYNSECLDNEYSDGSNRVIGSQHGLFGRVKTEARINLVRTDIHSGDTIHEVQSVNLNTKLSKPKSVLGSVETNGCIKASKFKCGYCNFSADLRVKVKMHCSKRHCQKDMLIIEPLSKCQDSKVNKSASSNSENSMRVNANDWKGTRFENDLRNAGVSKLDLASLFPKSERFRSMYMDEDDEDDDGIDDDDDDEDDDDDDDSEVDMPFGEAMNASAHNQLQIPFKKVTAPSKIDVSLTQCMPDNKEPEFKKPLNPVSLVKSADKKRDKKYDVHNGQSNLTVCNKTTAKQETINKINVSECTKTIDPKDDAEVHDIAISLLPPSNCHDQMKESTPIETSKSNMEIQNRNPETVTMNSDTACTGGPGTMPDISENSGEHMEVTQEHQLSARHQDDVLNSSDAMQALTSINDETDMRTAKGSDNHTLVNEIPNFQNDSQNEDAKSTVLCFDTAAANLVDAPSASFISEQDKTATDKCIAGDDDEETKDCSMSTDGTYTLNTCNSHPDKTESQICKDGLDTVNNVHEIINCHTLPGDSQAVKTSPTDISTLEQSVSCSSINSKERLHFDADISGLAEQNGDVVNHIVPLNEDSTCVGPKKQITDDSQSIEQAELPKIHENEVLSHSTVDCSTNIGEEKMKVSDSVLDHAILQERDDDIDKHSIGHTPNVCVDVKTTVGNNVIFQNHTGDNTAVENNIELLEELISSVPEATEDSMNCVVNDKAVVSTVIDSKLADKANAFEVSAPNVASETNDSFIVNGKENVDTDDEGTELKQCDLEELENKAVLCSNIETQEWLAAV